MVLLCLQKTAMIGAGLGLILAASTAQAHHSYSMFDRSKTDTVAGVVKSLDLVNPHGWLVVLASNTTGPMTEYSLELGGPSQMEREGWTPQSLQPGDKITVRLYPLRDGSHGGQLVSAVLANGKTLGGGGPPGGGRGGPPGT